MGGLASAAADLFWKDLPLDRYAKLVEGYENADAKSVQRAAESYFEPARQQIVLVGDPDTVRMQVPSLNLGELTVREPPEVGGQAKRR